MTDDVRGSTLNLLRDDLESATAAKKCHGCGCFHDAVAALGATELRTPLADTLEKARHSLGERRYECLGCKLCWPADALNRAVKVLDLPASAGCPTDAPERRDGWPPYPGEYRTIRYASPVAVCTLHSRDLVDATAAAAPAGLSIVGALQTENLGIERIVENVVANPHIRVLLICGEDTPGRIGHFPGQSLISLVENGIDERARIVGAAGKRPVLQNIGADLVEHFRRQVRVVDHRGLVDAGAVAAAIEDAAACSPGPIDDGPVIARAVRTIRAAPAERLVLDRAGYVVVVPDRRRMLLVAEHYDNRGVLDAVVEGRTGTEIVATLLREGLVTRADHAAYLGREFALAEMALREGSVYVQDAAPGDEPAPEDGVRDLAPSESCSCSAKGSCS
ncbi:MAG: DUF4346 domain-containing protein [Planctomycetota bacterium]|nr:MAG: DUF4346 domain-containing protein [Planctomycetota bacterium]